jgi:hypothetical protein
MMSTDAGLHADQARWHVGKPCFHLATRPLLTQHNCTALIEANNVKPVLADIDADYGDCGFERVGHGVLLVFGAPCQLRSLAGQEHGRTIPLAEVARLFVPSHDGVLKLSKRKPAWPKSELESVRPSTSG